MLAFASLAGVLALAPLAGDRALCASAAAADESSRLTFRAADGKESSLSKAELRARCEIATVRVDDPYYGEPRRFAACPLERVFELGFGAPPAAFPAADFLFVALDGYSRSAPASQLAEGGAYLALDDAAKLERGEHGFEAIDRRQLDAGPFYLVWSGAEQADAHRYPWPYQLARIEQIRFEERFPHSVPRGASADDPAQRGFEIFRRECISCHAINGEGGRVGPELNVPRSIVEYRDPEEIKAYVRDPASFRYTTMPAHLHLSGADLDALIAYFRFMSSHKHDPGAPPSP